jgi:hypothetical protein
VNKSTHLTFGNEVYVVLNLAAFLALVLLVIARLGFDANWPLFIGGTLVSFVIAIVIHELGHVGAALAFRQPVAEVRIGSGPVVLHFRVRGTIVRLGSNLIASGKVWLTPSAAKLGRGKGAVYSGAGIAVNAMAASAALAFGDRSPNLFTAFFAVNAWLVFSNLVPTDGSPLPTTDGTKILFRLGMLPRFYHEAIAALTPHTLRNATVEDLPLELWTANADHAVTAAMDIAAAQRAEHIGTEHLLAGVLHDPQSPGARALIGLGFNADMLATALAPGAATGPPEWSAPAVAALVYAVLIAKPESGAGSGELCLGVLGTKTDSGSSGSTLLAGADITLNGFGEALGLAVHREVMVGCTGASHVLWAQRAGARLRAQRYADARSDYLAMIDHSPDPRRHAITTNNAAWAALMSGNPDWTDEALKHAQGAVEAEPNVAEFRGTLAFALLETGKPGDAMAALDGIDDSSMAPRSRASNLCVRALVEANLGDTEASTRHAREAEAIDPACELLSRARAVAPGHGEPATART